MPRVFVRTWKLTSSVLNQMLWGLVSLGRMAANILPPTLKTCSSPHWIDNVAPGSDNRCLATASYPIARVDRSIAGFGNMQRLARTFAMDVGDVTGDQTECQGEDSRIVGEA